MQIPQDLRYTDNHEWVRMESDGAVTLGISDYAQKALHDVVYVDLPDVDRIVEAGESIAEVESTKSVNDVYSPIPGVVATVNESLMDAPELINSDPFGAGWIVTITPAQGSSLDDLMDAVAYAAFTEE